MTTRRATMARTSLLAGLFATLTSVAVIVPGPPEDQHVAQVLHLSLIHI